MMSGGRRVSARHACAAPRRHGGRHFPTAKHRLFHLRRNYVAIVIVAATATGLALRLLYLLHGGFLLGVTEYDDGPYFASAVRLIQGGLPYRDFVFVQPPGITLLMVPSALLAKATSTAWGLASGRVLTALAGAAGVTLMGLLVRHRGVFVTVVACGLMAVYPAAVAAAHTVLVEPWLVLFCLLGAVLIFDGDHLTASHRRLARGGAAFGFAGVVEGWAIVPVALVLVLCLLNPLAGRARLSRVGPFAAGVAAAFLAPVLPLGTAAPRRIYQDVIVAQLGPRYGAVRVGLLERLYELTGLSDVSVVRGSLRVPVSFTFFHASVPLPVLVYGLAVLLVWITIGVPLFLSHAGSQAPPPLAWFAMGGTALVTAMLLWPPQFYYHFAAFLAPFLALAIALPLAGLLTHRAGTPPRGEPAPRPGPSAREPTGDAGAPAAPRPPWHRRRAGWAATAAAMLVTILAVVQATTEDSLVPVVPPQAIGQADRLIPPGPCVASDLVSMLLLANRFNSTQPGCAVIDDGRGADLALSGGRTPYYAAGAVPAVAALWHACVKHARFLWLSRYYARRVAGSPALWRYLRRHFTLIYADRHGDRLYRRTERAVMPYSSL